MNFSVIVPTYHRLERLSDLLVSLTNLEYSFTQFEVIVVDDSGIVPLEPTISKFHEQLNLTLLKQDNTGPAAARNRGAAQAKGEFLAFTDDDCLADSAWLHSLAKIFIESPHCICGGRTVNALRENLYSTASQLLLDYLYEHYNPVENLEGFFPTNNFAVPKKSFLDMGGFDPTLRFGENRDFCYRWAFRGYPFIFAPEAVVYHIHALTLFSLLKQHFSYGEGTFQFRRRCAIRGLRPVKLNPLSWYVNLVLSGIRKERNPKENFP